MSSFRETLSRVWNDLNPREPSPWYLAKLAATMVVLMALALVIEQLK